MKLLYKPLSWGCYYLGDFSCKILELNDNSELWVGFWYPVYNTLMGWSGDLQDTAGFDPMVVTDTTGWPWYKSNEREEE
jgi:hypothetical protein